MGPIKRYRLLWKSRKDRNTQAITLLYIVNLFTFIVGILYSLFFFQVSKPMFVLSCYFFIYNIYLYFTLEKGNTTEFSNLILMELWLFLICAVLFIGWGYGFQQYIYCILCCFFLPFYLPENQKKDRYHRVGIGLLLIITYFVLFYICNFTNLQIGISGSVVKMNIVYAINSFISAIAVMTFSAFSTALGVDDRRNLSRRADFDQLTGLYNRYALNQLLESKIKNNEEFYVAIVDIDFFKKINDTYGHNVGDSALKKLTSIFKKYSKEYFDVGRWGGEEFLIISKSPMKYERFVTILDNMRKNIEKSKFNLLGNNIKFTISIGTSRYIEGEKLEKIIKKADDNLYVAKENGRNKIIA